MYLYNKNLVQQTHLKKTRFFNKEFLNKRIRFINNFYASYAKKEENVQNSLGKTFRPEFLNRIDYVLVFKDLGPHELAIILEQLCERSREKLKVSYPNLSFILSPSYKKLLIKYSYQSGFGARPLLRIFNRLVENPLITFLEDMDPNRFKNTTTVLYLTSTNTLLNSNSGEQVKFKIINYCECSTKPNFYSKQS